MKYQLLFLSLIGTTLVASLFSDRPSLAEPAPIFQPIIEEIRDRHQHCSQTIVTILLL